MPSKVGRATLYGDFQQDEVASASKTAAQAHLQQHSRAPQLQLQLQSETFLRQSSRLGINNQHHQPDLSEWVG